jgi:hypothetical protein
VSGHRASTVVVAALGIPALIGGLALGAAGCATTPGAPGPAGPTATLVTGWEQHFTLEWDAVDEPGGTRRVRGYVHSRSGQAAEPFRVLAQALDGAGRVTGQRIAWVPGGVPGFARSYFEVPGLPAAAAYRVAVWDFTMPSHDGDGRM